MLKVEISRWWYEAQWRGRSYFYIQRGVGDDDDWFGMWFSKGSHIHQAHKSGNPYIRTYAEHHT